MELHTLIEIYSLLPLHFEESLHTHKIETLMVCFTHLLFTFSGHYDRSIIHGHKCKTVLSLIFFELAFFQKETKKYTRVPRRERRVIQSNVNLNLIVKVLPLSPPLLLPHFPVGTTAQRN